MAAEDAYQNNGPHLTSPPERMFSITPHASNELAQTTRAIWVGTGGDLEVVGKGDSSAQVLKNVASGSLIVGRFKQVVSTNTTATNLVGMY